jgi:two-component system, sensor histidine kinase and response regulator
MTMNGESLIPLLRQGSVLVVDDEESNRMLLSALLERDGYRVALAQDGKQALESIAHEIPDVILLDVMMPGMDGHTVCRQIRVNPRTAHVPVLMVTALTEREDRLTGIAAGANDFLAKPIDVPNLRLRVRNAVYSKQLHDQVQDDLRRLKSLEDLRDRLVHMLAHDMRAPLTVISTTLELVITESANQSAPWVGDLQSTINACHRLIGMINCMLDVSRMECGQLPMKCAPYDLLDICRDATQVAIPSAHEKELDVRVNGEPVFASVDRDIVRRVVINLLWNAIKFSPARGKLIVDVTSASGNVKVSVTDQGPGILREHHQRIFEKFGQVQSARQGSATGSGLGLTFCKLAVEAHGGRIGVESEVGQGSTFWFTLPEAPPAP